LGLRLAAELPADGLPVCVSAVAVLSLPFPLPLLAPLRFVAVSPDLDKGTSDETSLGFVAFVPILLNSFIGGRKSFEIWMSVCALRMKVREKWRMA